MRALADTDASGASVFGSVRGTGVPGTGVRGTGVPGTDAVLAILRGGAAGGAFRSTRGRLPSVPRALRHEHAVGDRIPRGLGHGRVVGSHVGALDSMRVNFALAIGAGSSAGSSADSSADSEPVSELNSAEAPAAVLAAIASDSGLDPDSAEVIEALVASPGVSAAALDPVAMLASAPLANSAPASSTNAARAIAAIFSSAGRANAAVARVVDAAAGVLESAAEPEPPAPAPLAVEPGELPASVADTGADPAVGQIGDGRDAHDARGDGRDAHSDNDARYDPADGYDGRDDGAGAAALAYSAAFSAPHLGRHPARSALAAVFSA